MELVLNCHSNSQTRNEAGLPPAHTFQSDLHYLLPPSSSSPSAPALATWPSYSNNPFHRHLFLYNLERRIPIGPSCKPSVVCVSPVLQTFNSNNKQTKPSRPRYQVYQTRGRFLLPPFDGKRQNQSASVEPSYTKYLNFCRYTLFYVLFSLVSILGFPTEFVSLLIPHSTPFLLTSLHTSEFKIY